MRLDLAIENRKMGFGFQYRKRYEVTCDVKDS